MELQKRRELFASPTSYYRAKPFWAWNGKLEKEELLRQIDVMKEMGFGGFFMHSRTGLETEYLGEEWFDLINACADHGAKEGMEVWLYDEDRWPSGSAGGMVTVKQENRARFLEYRTEDAEPYLGAKNCVAAFAVKMDGEFISEYRMLEGDRALKAGEILSCATVEMAKMSDNYNGTCYADTMNRAATEDYIRLTHQKYKEKCGERLGKSVMGIFTDEPHRGACMTTFGGKINRVSWTPAFLEEFKKRRGYDLTHRLPELFGRMKGKPVSRVTRDYFETAEELFLENFAIPIQDWCRENRLMVTGHALHEDSLCAQTAMQGSLMRHYEYMDAPGMDLLTEHNRCYWNAKQVSSVARQLGKGQVLSETNGCTGWQMSFESYKNIGDWQALYGVNLRCPHLSWYTMKGEAKRDYPASILHQSGWYTDYHLIEDYYARIHAATDGAEPQCGLLVVSPIESVWARMYPGAIDSLEAADPDVKNIEDRYRRTFRRLTENRIDFDYGEEDIMARHGRVEKGVLWVGRAPYTKVLVSGPETLRATTLALLRSFADQGGQVIFAGAVPGYVDAEPSGDVQALAQRSLRVDLESPDLIAACQRGDEVKVTGEGREKVLARGWQVDGGRMALLINDDRRKDLKGLAVCLGKGAYVEAWDPRSGRMTRAEDAVQNGETGEWELALNLERGGERLYFLGDGSVPETEKTCDAPAEETAKVTLPDAYRYTLDEPNVCVLDMVKAQGTLSGGEKLDMPVMEALKADRAIRDRLGLRWRGGEMLQPWYEAKYDPDARTPLAGLSLTFAVQVSVLPSGVELALEDMENVKGLYVNGEKIDAVSAGKWIDICFDRVRIPDSAWRKGENRIRINMDYTRMSGLESMYLLGRFGVELAEGKTPVLTVLPERLALGDITGQGLPFYSGRVRYEMDDVGLAGRALRVRVDAFGGALVKIVGKQTRTLAFAPFEAEVEDLSALEVALTRRNTFGPLHQVPRIADAYGPDNFMTVGDQWSEEYGLIPQGLLMRPEAAELAKGR